MFRSALICLALALSAAAQAQSYPTPTFQSVITSADPRFYGAKCDGVTDDTTALQAWAAATIDRAHLIVSGVCVFKAQIAFPPTVYGVTIEGNGHSGKLLYAGASTTLDPIIQIGAQGPVACQANGWAIKGLHVVSSTVMTAGDGLRISDACNMQIDDLTVGGNLDGGNKNLFNAVRITGGNSIYLRGYGFQGSNNGLVMSGDLDGSHPLIDPMLTNGYIVHGLVGLHICGNVGGLMADSTDVLQNGTNVLIDQSCSAHNNGQLLFGAHFLSDVTAPSEYPAAPQIGVHVSDPGGYGLIIIYRGWLASATNQCLTIDSMGPPTGLPPGPQLSIKGATIGNCHSSSSSVGAAINNQDTYYAVSVTGTSFFTSQASFPTIYNVAGAPPMSIQSIAPDSGFNISGSWGGFYASSIGQLISADPSGAQASMLLDGSANVNGYSIRMTGNGVTTPRKWLRAQNGQFLISNDAGSPIVSVTDAGVLATPASFTIATLPACTTPTRGAITWVTNGQASPPYLGAVSTTGSTIAPVFCNGSGWVYH